MWRNPLCMQVKRRLGKASGFRVSAAQIVELFQKNEIPDAGQEKVSETFVETCMYSSNHALCITEVMSTLINSEDQGPFDSVNKMAGVSRKCKLGASKKSSGVLPSCWTWCKKATQHLEVQEHVLKVIPPDLGIDRAVVHEMQQHLDTAIQYRKVIPSSTKAGSEETDDFKTPIPSQVWQAKWTMPINERIDFLRRDQRSTRLLKRSTLPEMANEMQTLRDIFETGEGSKDGADPETGLYRAGL